MPKVGTMTIASSGTQSTTLDVSDLKDFSIHPPAALTGTCTLQGSADGGTTYADAQSDGSDITVTAGKILTVTKLSTGLLRIESGSAEGAERVFHVYSSEGNPR